ncbi:hypothetical protein HDG38_003851 [Paraburkholderia sp. WSM4177]|nr:hypothetical protein [Paraburkholderia sp. WSM4177]MBB5485770.1 hypothetical protein [Paraburkholderia sp. WSM4180]
MEGQRECKKFCVNGHLAGDCQQREFDNKKERVRLLFSGATRCWANDFLIQNIVYSIKVLTDFNSDEYRKALASLDKAYSWGKGKPLKNIAVLEATLGAELLIEFDSLEVEPESSV